VINISVKPQDFENKAHLYLTEADDISHGAYKGPDELEPMARIEPQEMHDEEPEDGEVHEGDYVDIDGSVGGGIGKVIQVSPEGTHAIIKLVDGKDSNLDKGDNMAVHLSDIIKLDDSDLDTFGDDDVNWGDVDKFSSEINRHFKGLR
tara:strand:- start:289 stop:732 length:444 start_codon:yes stop_codon:yes gene_type:complete